MKMNLLNRLKKIEQAIKPVKIKPLIVSLNPLFNNGSTNAWVSFGEPGETEFTTIEEAKNAFPDANDFRVTDINTVFLLLKASRGEFPMCCKGDDHKEENNGIETVNKS